MQRLTRRDWSYIAICLLVTAVSLSVGLTKFNDAFPEASIDFRHDRESSRALAENLLAQEQVDTAPLRHTVVFDSDDPARIFLERALGLERAQRVMKDQVRLWYWHHRWFRPLQEEEVSVDIAPTGELVAYHHRIPEARAMPETELAAARETAMQFLRRAGIDPLAMPQVDQSERRLPNRLQRIFIWESTTIRPGGAPYRYRVAVDGAKVTEYSQELRVPESWQRSYQELRSKNHLAGQVDTVFLVLTMIAALVVFIVRLRRGDMSLRFLLAIGGTSLVLVTGVALNSFPMALAGYETTSSYPAFLTTFIVGTVLQSAGTAVMLLVVCGSGEVLYRERFPSHLALPRLWSPRALGSKRVFLAFVLGYTMVAFFLAYQVVFYLVAARFGAWAPADIPYDDMLNSAIPWVAVLFAGFFPAFSEEFLSRAFSIPFFERVMRSRWTAIIVAGFIWGFGHSTYPNQPFYIRGVEVGVAGVVIGFLMFRFGLLPLLIWHYTVDAVYTSLLLFRSGNTYYVVSAAMASLVFAVPMIAAIGLYLKRGGFVPDESLSNHTLPLAPAPPPAPRDPEPELPPAKPLRPSFLFITVVVVALAAILAVSSAPGPDDAIDYKIDRAEAKEIAQRHLERLLPAATWERVIAVPQEGFRYWNRDSRREEGGAPGGFDDDAAEHLIANGLSMRDLAQLFRESIHAGLWTIRFFTPMKKEEYFVDVDPRTRRPLGFHKYLDEAAPGPRLTREAALAIATRAFAVHGEDSRSFVLKEALAFPQPNRTDWLFHFDGRQPIADAVFRRATVRVCGSELTQFAVTVKAPEEVSRRASTETLRNTLLLVLKLVGAIALIAFVAAGFVTATQTRRPRWSVAARWALILAILPVIDIAMSHEASLFRYGTSVQWETFRAALLLEHFRDAALRITIVFLAIAAIDAAWPGALAVLSREGRRRFGKSAIAAALTAVAAFAIVRSMFEWIVATWPRLAPVSVEVSDLVAVPLPALAVVCDTLFAAVAGAGAAAAFVRGVTGLRVMRSWLPDLVTPLVVFCASIDSGATVEQMPLMLVRSATLALLTWAIGRFILGANFLAWPVAILSGVGLGSIATLLANDRPDLRISAAVLAVALISFYVWLATSRGGEEEGRRV